MAIAVLQPVDIWDQIREVAAHLGDDPDEASTTLAAQALVKGLRQQYPRQFSAWLQERAVSHIVRDLGDLARSNRKLVGREIARQQFADAVKSGEPKSLGVFARVDFPVDGGVRRRLGDMTGKDFRFVASGYRADSKTLALKAAICTELAKKLGDKTLSEVYSESQFKTEYGSLLA